MIKSYLKIIFRSVLKSPWLSAIKILGLTIGITCSIFIYLFVSNELSYDRFHKNADRIYRVATDGIIGDTKISQTFTSAPLSQALRNGFPEIESSVRISKNDFKVKQNNNVFFEKRAIIADPELFEIFTFPFIEGSTQEALNEPNMVVITQSYSNKIFGNANPINQTLLINDTISCKVSGIIQDIPDNSHFHFDFVVSAATFAFTKSNDWWSNSFQTYILLKKESDPEKLEAKFPEFVSNHLFGGKYDNFESKGNRWHYYLQPLTSIHLKSDISGELEANGNSSYVKIFSIAGIFILLIASINYINLTTAKTTNRISEIGIKKAVGAGKTSLRIQFIGESVIFMIIALLIAVVIIKAGLSSYNNFINKDLHFDLFTNPFTIPSLLLFALLIGTISGSYPAFLLSSINPVQVLKGNKYSDRKNTRFRNFLVITQFTISIVLIVSTIIIGKQLDYIKDERLGFNKDQVLVVKNRHLVNKEDKVLKELLLKSPNVLDVTVSKTIPGKEHNNIEFTAEQITDPFTLNLCVCDEDYKEVMGLTLAEGRFFQNDMESDKNSVLINQAAARLCAYKDGPIGKIFSNKYKVIGVVNDYHYESKHQKIRPMILMNKKGVDWMVCNYVSLKISGKQLNNTIGSIKKIWDENADNTPFEYSFLDDSYDQLYKNEQQTGTLFSFFAVLAIFIACIGLIGLSSFTIQRKIKEVGIRKVNGARISEVLIMLNRDFAKWVAIAFVIATPVAYYTMNKWLESFAYKTTLSWWIFALAGLMALGIALLTVSWQSWRAATRNPVDALRYE